MDTVAPEAPEPSATAEVTAERAAPRRRWKVPTSIVVTFLGIALTAWLLPAFTRQWDDRAKARELEASIIADMASATARTMVSTRRGESGREAADQWLLASVDIEARLRAYFAPSVVASWQVYSYFVDQLVRVTDVQADATLANAITWMAGDGDWYEPPLPSDPALSSPRPVQQRHYLPHDVAAAADNALDIAPALRRDDPGLHELEQLLDHFTPGIRGLVPSKRTVEEQETQLLDFEEVVGGLVLAGHPRGYSTSGRDLINDLLPF